MTASVDDLRVVAFGGGTGMAALLTGLKKYTGNITAVVTVTDDGGSSGFVRKDFDVAAPGDIRNCILALADSHPLWKKIFQYRYEDEGDFKGHCLGNLIIAAASDIVGSFEDSVEELNGLLDVRGRVIPAAADKVFLVARHSDGTKSTGEVQIGKSGKLIEKIELRPGPVKISRQIRQAVRGADLFLFGPGSLFTSVIPNLLLEGLTAEITKNGSPRVYIGNIMTQPGETDGFRLSDHIRAMRRHVGDDFPDCVVAQAGGLPPAILERYEQENAVPVVADLRQHSEFDDIEVITRNFFKSGDVARHDPDLLAECVFDEFLSSSGSTHAGRKTNTKGADTPARSERPGKRETRGLPRGRRQECGKKHAHGT